MRRQMILFSAVALASCNQAHEQPVEELQVVEIPPTDLAADLSEEDRIRVCKAAQAFGVGRPVDGIEANNSPDGLVRLSYTRDDGKSFRYDCKIEGNTVKTRMIDESGPGTGPGVWSGRGSSTVFEMREGKIHISETYSDGSSTEGGIEI